MDLYEYQGKELFRRFGIPVSDGRLATSPREAHDAAEDLGTPVVVKAQVLTGGRGKAGGIKLAATPGRGRAPRARDPRHGHPRPRRPAALDRARLRHRARVLPLGHVRPRREEGALHADDARAASTSRRSRPSGPRRSRACTSTRSRASSRTRRAGSSTRPASTTRASRSRSCEIVEKLYAAFVGCDAMLCEINPLIVTPSGEVRALDSKFSVDDNALYKHPRHRRHARPGGGAARGALRAREGRHLREARRRRRRARQRRGPVDVDGRRRDLRRRPACELLRPGRRRRRGGRRGRARGDHARPAGAARSSSTSSAASRAATRSRAGSSRRSTAST